MTRPAAGFTLIEIMVAIGLTAAIVLTALQIFQRTTAHVQRANPDRTRDLAAQVFLDRFEGELLGTLLVQKPEEEDRLGFPWVFAAEDRVFGTNDSDGLRFVTHAPARLPGAGGAGIRMVSYAVESGEGPDRLDLYRLEERLPENLQKEVRVTDGQPVLEDVHRFSLRFQDEETGEWRDGWDSTDLAMLDTLPSQVEVSLQLYQEGEEGELVAGDEHTRAITLPVRPLSREDETEGGDEGEDEIEQCLDGPSIIECIERLAPSAQVREELLNIMGVRGNVCWAGDSATAVEARAFYSQQVPNSDPLQDCQ